MMMVMMIIIVGPLMVEGKSSDLTLLEGWIDVLYFCVALCK
jgi:hypothetical protein